MSSLEYNDRNINLLFNDIETLFEKDTPMFFYVEENVKQKCLTFFPPEKKMFTQIVSSKTIEKEKNGKIMRVTHNKTTIPIIYVDWFLEENVFTVRIFGSQYLKKSETAEAPIYSIAFQAGMHLGSNCSLFERKYGHISVEKDCFNDFIRGFVYAISQEFIF